MADPFGRALLDYARGEQDAPLYQRDGDERLVHPVGDFYFDEFAEQPAAEWTESLLHGPLLDAGAGAGRDALHFQERFETVALEVSDHLVELLDRRGVEQVLKGDLFALPETFDRDRFRSILVVGTQIGLAGSINGLRILFEAFATVTTADGTVVLDAYDPTYDGGDDLLGFSSSPEPGVAYREIRYEYEGAVGDSLRILLFSPERLRDATAGTDWRVAEIERPHDAYYYRAALRKSQ